MVVSLHYVQRVVGDIFVRHIPGVAVAAGILMAFDAADANSLALTKRIKT